MKKIIKLAVLLAVLALFLTVPGTEAKEFNSSAEGISLTLDFGNGTTVDYQDLDGTDVLNVTESVVPVEVEWTGDNAFVTSIADSENEPDRNLWWQYWVNGELGAIAANKMTLSDGDAVVWRKQSTVYEGTEPDTSLFVGAAVVGVFGLIILLALYKRKYGGT